MNKINTIIKGIINSILLTPVFMVLMTVFIIHSAISNPTVNGKHFWFISWMAVSSITMLIFVLMNRRNVLFSLLDLFLLIFVITGLIVSDFSIHDVTTKNSLLIFLLLLYFYFRLLLSYRKNKFFITLFLIVTVLVEAIWGLMQLYGLKGSQHELFLLTGSFFNPGPYSGYLSVILPVVFYYSVSDYRVFNKRFTKRFTLFYIRGSISIITFLMVLIVLPATMSRASWIASMGGIGFICLFFLWKRYNWKVDIKKDPRKTIGIAVLGLAVVVLGGISMYYLKKDSADGRTLIWKVSSKAVLNHPLGVGTGHFSGVYAEEQANYFASGLGTEQEQYVAGNPEYAFNEYLQICIEFGLLPFLLFICIVISALYKGYIRKYIPETAALVSLLIFAGMSYPFSILPILIVMMFLLASCVVDKSTEIVTRKWIFSFKKQLCFLFLAIIISLKLLGEYLPVYNAYKDWNYAKSLHRVGYHYDARNEYESLMPYLKDQINFLFEYARLLSSLEEYENSNQVLERVGKISGDPMIYNIMGKNYQSLKQYGMAEKCFLKSSNIVPNRHYPFYLLANLYVETGEISKAREFALYLIEKKPKIPSNAIEEMQAEMKRIIESK